MSPVLLVGLVLVVLMAQKLVDIYCGGHYMCPACGARDQGMHSPDCPWSRSRSSDGPAAAKRSGRAVELETASGP